MVLNYLHYTSIFSFRQSFLESFYDFQDNYSIFFSCVLLVFMVKYVLFWLRTMPLWRNWQTHLTQNQAVNNRAGSSPASGIAKKDLPKHKLMQIFFSFPENFVEFSWKAKNVLPSKKQLLKERKPLSKNLPSAAWFFLKGVLLLLSVVISYLFPNIFSYSGVPSSVAK